MQTLLQWPKAALVWLKRWQHRKGFGIQSPWAYRLVRYVVCERTPYYAYERLRRETPSDWATRRIGQLLLRLSNHWRPSLVALYGEQHDALARYIQTGCKTAQMAGEESLDEAQMVLMAADEHAKAAYERMALTAGTEKMLVVLNIGCAREARNLWQHITADSRATTTFDLYYCGIAFFDPKRYKQNYIVNF